MVMLRDFSEKKGAWFGLVIFHDPGRCVHMKGWIEFSPTFRFFIKDKGDACSMNNLLFWMNFHLYWWERSLQPIRKNETYTPIDLIELETGTF